MSIFLWVGGLEKWQWMGKNRHRYGHRLMPMNNPWEGKAAVAFQAGYND